MNIWKETKLSDLKFIAIQLLLIVTFGLASLEKWVARTVPSDFIAEFSDTWLNLIPGSLVMAFYMIATLEATAFVMFIISVAKTEWLSASNKVYLKTGLILTLFMFVIFSFGLRLTDQPGETANVFLYFGVLLFALFLAERESVRDN